MPMLRLFANVEIPDQQAAALGASLTAVLADITGKPVEKMLVQVAGSQHITFAGSGDPAAFVECKSVGLTPEGAKELSAGLCTHIFENVGVAPERTYIDFKDLQRPFVGHKGTTLGD